MHWQLKLPGDWDQLGGLLTWHLRPYQRGGSHEGEAGNHDTDTEQSQNLRAMMQKMATVVANLQHYKSQAEELWKVNQAQDEQLKALKDLTSASTSKLAFNAALGVTNGPFQQNTPLKYQKILFNIGSGYNPANWHLHRHGPGGVLLQIHNVQQQLRTAQLSGVTDDELPEIGDYLGHRG